MNDSRRDAETRRTCGECRWWVSGTVRYCDFWGDCMNTTVSPDYMDEPHIGYAGILGMRIESGSKRKLSRPVTGKNFGCIHFEAKDENPVV